MAFLTQLAPELKLHHAKPFQQVRFSPDPGDKPDIRASFWGRANERGIAICPDTNEQTSKPEDSNHQPQTEWVSSWPRCVAPRVPPTLTPNAEMARNSPNKGDEQTNPQSLGTKQGPCSSVAGLEKGNPSQKKLASAIGRNEGMHLGKQPFLIPASSRSSSR